MFRCIPFGYDCNARKRTIRHAGMIRFPGSDRSIPRRRWHCSCPSGSICTFFIIWDFQYPLRKVILWDIVVSPFRRLERESGLPHLSAPDRRLEDTGVQRFERLIVSDRISLSNQASSRLSPKYTSIHSAHNTSGCGVKSSDTNVLSFVSDFS